MINDDIYEFEDISNDIPIEEVEAIRDSEEGESDHPIMGMVTKLQDPGNIMSTEEKEKLKFLANSENAVKVSLVNLFMNQFGTVEKYDSTINDIMNQLSKQITHLEPDELLNFLSVLSKARSSEAKNIMDMFKKQGEDIKIIFKETAKISKKQMNQVEDDEDSDDTKKDSPLLNMSPEKRDKLLRVINKLKGNL